MKKHRDQTPEAFDKFLQWLDPDREQAGLMYLQIRRSLVAMFQARCCLDAEELADETINRVSRRMSEVGETYVGSRAAYFQTVAHHLHLEYISRESIRTELPESFELSAAETDSTTELISLELEKCLAELDQFQRDLILSYYTADKQEKIDHRKTMAARFGMTVETLRLNAHRIRKRLSDCLDRRLSPSH